jgi:hypothetical protein
MGIVFYTQDDKAHEMMEHEEKERNAMFAGFALDMMIQFFLPVIYFSLRYSQVCACFQHRPVYVVLCEHALNDEHFNTD